jgi:hypothetical protein
VAGNSIAVFSGGNCRGKKSGVVSRAALIMSFVLVVFLMFLVLFVLVVPFVLALVVLILDNHGSLSLDNYR